MVSTGSHPVLLEGLSYTLRPCSDTDILFLSLFLCREPFIILSGGLSYDTVGRRPCLTIMHGKSTAVLEMDYPIVDFLTLCETPYPNGAFSAVQGTFCVGLSRVRF